MSFFQVVMSVSPRGLTHRIKRGSRPQLIEDELDICRNVNFDNRYVFEVSWEVVNKGIVSIVFKTIIIDYSSLQCFDNVESAI